VAKKKETKATGKWDAELDQMVCDRYNNCNLTLTIKLYVKKVEPAGGTAKGTYKDADDTDRKIVRWGAKWLPWITKLRRECEDFWHGKFWLKCPSGFDKFDYVDKGVTYRPNVWCRFRLKVVSSPGTAHHKIEAVRLDNTEDFFRSHSELYDNRDLDPQPQDHGSVKKTHLHEIGHLLGLPHVGEGGPQGLGWAICALHTLGGGSTNDSQCYGVLDDEKRDVMGSGSERRAWHAKPWQEAIEMFSGIGQTQWQAEQKRYYPRSTDDVTKNNWPVVKPKRG